LRAQPGVDPERLGAHDLLLLVAHRPRHVHHVDDHRRVLRHLAHLPGAVALVLLEGDDHRVLGVVGPRRHRALQRLAVRALEVAQAFGADPGDAGVLVVVDQDRAAVLGLDERQRQLLAQDLGQLGDRKLDLEDVLARGVAAAGTARPGLPGRDRGADVARTLPHARLLVRAVAEGRQAQLRKRDGDRVLPLTADHLAVGDVLAKILPDLPPDDLPEPGVILLDLLDIGVGAVHPYSFEYPLAKMLATNERTSYEQVSQ